MSLSQRLYEIAERIRIIGSVAGGHHVLRIFAAVEKTDARQGAGQRWAVPFECKSLARNVTPFDVARLKP